MQVWKILSRFFLSHMQSADTCNCLSRFFFIYLISIPEKFGDKDKFEKAGEKIIGIEKAEIGNVIFWNNLFCTHKKMESHPQKLYP